MGYQKITTYADQPVPRQGHLALVLAGARRRSCPLLRRNRVGMFLGIMTVCAAVVFRVAPQARLWNARVLPFWFLCLYLLAGVAFMEAGAAGRRGAHARTSTGRGALIGVPIVTGAGRARSG